MMKRAAPKPARPGTRLLAGLVLALVMGMQASAATSQDLTVTVTLTIAADISVQWCDNTGNNGSTAAQTWALGTITLGGGPYDSDTQGTQPVLKYIKNLSNAQVDIAAACSNSTSWTVAGTAGPNQFMMEAKAGAGAYTSIHASVADVVNNLNNGATSGRLVMRFTPPTSITLGGGLPQAITVTYTATADNGD